MQTMVTTVIVNLPELNRARHQTHAEQMLIPMVFVMLTRSRLVDFGNAKLTLTGRIDENRLGLGKG